MLPNPAVAVLLFGSGFAALVYQTAWQRMLRLVFGASTDASAAVLAVFLGGLGAGGAWLGRRAERSHRPLLLYGNLEAGVALCAAVTPFLASAAFWLYTKAGGSLALGAAGAVALRVALTIVTLGPAVVLMGGTLPAAARAVEVVGDAARRRLATLYAVNTLGAVAGALAGTLLLFEVFGTRTSLWIACLANLLVAMVARSLGRSAPSIPTASDDATETSRAESPGEGAPPSRLRTAIAYGTAGFVGFGFLALELVWYRMLAPILGGTTFSFGIVLAVALAGIGTGGLVYSRRSEDRPATWSLLSMTLALEAVAIALPIAVGDRVAFYALATRQLGVVGFSSLVVTWMVIAGFVVFPTAFVSGYQFPVLFALLGRGRRGVARHVGFAYAFNTGGSILGALSAGFVLIPWLGAVETWRALAIAFACFATVLVLLDTRAAPQRLLRALPALGFVVSAGWLALAEGPTAYWRHQGIGAGRGGSLGKDRNDFVRERIKARAEVLVERDGVESAVALERANGLAFVVNGKVDGSVLGDRATQAMMSLPLLLHERPKTAFVLGLGTGMSAGYAARVAGVERVDVAELEPAIIEVARAAAAVNFDVLERPNVFVFRGDGREFLASVKRSYDVIVSEPSNPYRAGVASLFTQEFYRQVDERLSEGGLFGQWVQGYEVDTAAVRMIVRTLRSVFAHVEAWSLDPADFLFIASREAIAYDVGRLRERAAAEPYGEGLLRTCFGSGAEAVAAHFVARSDFLATLAGDGPVNTDDENWLEFAFARRAGMETPNAVERLLEASFAANAARLPVRGDLDWGYVDDLRARMHHIRRQKAPTRDGLPALSLRAKALQAGCFGALDRVLPRWTEAGSPEPRDLVETFVLARAHAADRDSRALELARRLHAEGFIAEAELVRAGYLANSSKDEALGALERAIDHLRLQPLALCSAGEQVLALYEILSRRTPALAKRGSGYLLRAPLAVFAHDFQRLLAAQGLAARSKEPEWCVRALGDQLAEPWWTEEFLRTRAECLTAAAHPFARGARDDLTQFILNEGGVF